jgi:hypothetical protein
VVKVVNYSPILGEKVAIIWKKQDAAVYGGTEGVVLGVVGDEVSGEYLVIDKSTYQDSFKSALLFLNILDLEVIPMQEIDLIKKISIRQRPPGISEEFNMIMETNYKSNIDFNSTVYKVETRHDCKSKRAGNKYSENYQIVIKEIKSIERASINIFCTGTVQIFCIHKDLDQCINWIQKAVILLEDHNRLVLIPTKITYKINDTYREPLWPTDKIIHRIAKAKDDQPVVLPLGWVHKFFVELNENPLGQIDQTFKHYLFNTRKRGNKGIAYPDDSIASDEEQPITLKSPISGVTVNKYLGSGAPIMEINGLIKSPKDEEELMKMWISSRSDKWQWFSNNQNQNKVVLRDLTINRKDGVYSVKLCKYYGDSFR